MAANNDRVTEAFKATINGNKAAEPYFKEIQICLNSVYTHSHTRPKTLSSLDVKDAP